MVNDEQIATVGKQNIGNTVHVFLIIVPLIIVSCSLLYFYTSSHAKPDNNITLQAVETPIPELPLPSTRELKTHENVTITRKRIIVQPSCTTEEHIKETLREIWMEMHVKKEMCTPEDFHDVKKHNVPNLASNNNKVAEPRGHFVIYIAVGLLLTSLMAAFLDVYKVKGKPSKSKPQLTKRCSLADLTVLRHSRRESMRRDSMIDEHRAPLKLLDKIPIPE